MAFLSGMGVVASSYLILRLLRLLRFVHLYTRSSSLHGYHHGTEPWALVTGASDGIGLGFAQELAIDRFNVVLHGRNPTKLEDAKARLNREFPTVQFRILVADASNPSTTQFEDIVASISDLNLTVLVNNVGGGTVCKAFEGYTADEADAMMSLNARFPAQLTCALLPIFTRKDGPCLIINIGSMGTAGVPYAVPYGGAKAFLMSMSKSLDVEMRVEGKRIETLAILVGKLTGTGLNSKDPVTFFTPNARTMARAALARVGCGRAEVVGYVGHAMQQFAFDALPAWARGSVLVPVMKRYKDEYLRNK